MSYASPADLREMQPQIEPDVASDERLQRLLDRATDMIDLVLGSGFAQQAPFYTAGDRVVTSYGTAVISLPPHEVGSITRVRYGDVDLTGWSEEPDGMLRLAVATYTARSYGWSQGPYAVTANWGYGPPPPAIAEVCLEIASNLWHEKDRKGFSDVIGVEAGGQTRVGYTRALTNRQKMILDETKARYRGPVIV